MGEEGFMEKTVLITGAAKRLGRAIAISLAAYGYDIAIHYNTSKDEAVSLKKEIEDIGQSAMLFQCDLSHQKEVESLIPEICNKMQTNSDPRASA